MDMQVFGELEYVSYITDDISSNKINTIEGEESAVNSSIISNYSESLSSHISAHVGLRIQIIPNLPLMVAKSWNPMVNNISYTYLDNISDSKKVKVNYDPLAIPIHYTF